MCLQNAMVTGPKFTKFLTHAEGHWRRGVAILLPLWYSSTQNESEVCQFSRFPSKFGYHSNVRWTIAKMKDGLIMPTHMCTCWKRGEDRSSTFCGNWSPMVPLKIKIVTLTEHEPVGGACRRANKCFSGKW